MNRLFSIGLMIAAGFGLAPRGDDGPERIEAPGIENAFRLSPGLYSGGQPEGDEAFRVLAELGVRTIVSVDGAAPDLELAKQHGLRYVHLPVGYDGIPADRAIALAKVARELPGPIFVHCHHGKHRGPAAAAVCGMAREGWSKDRAKEWLGLAGTSPDYVGLFASVDRFAPPSEDELAALDENDLPERADVPDLVEGMVEVDLRWEQLKAVAEAGFRTPKDHPDLDPPHEATLLAEHYRELHRLDESKGRGETFLEELRDAEQNAIALRDSLRSSPPDLIAANAAFANAANDCKSCHVRFRDASP